MKTPQPPLFTDEPIVGPDGTRYLPGDRRETADRRLSYIHPETAVPTIEGHDLNVWATLADNEDSNGRTPYDKLVA